MPGPATSSHHYYENHGQIIDGAGNAQPSIKYYSNGSGEQLYFAADKIHHVLRKGGDSVGSTLAPDTLARLDVRFDCRVEGEYCGDIRAFQQSADFLNYYLPHCGANGITGVKGWKTIMYQNAFPGIDVRYTANTSGPVMYFVIHPGANPSSIRLVMAGHDSLLQYVGGSLRAALAQQSVIFPKGTVYQIDASGNPYIVPSWFANWFKLNDSTVSLSTGSYNTADDLVIKIGAPVTTGTTAEGNKEWFTFYGNQGDEGWAKMKADANGDLYHVTERTGVDFPVQPGSVTSSQTQNSIGAQDLLATKFNANAVRVWATYFGGTGNETIDEVGVSAGSSGDMYFVGSTVSTNIPILQVSGGYNQTANSNGFSGATSTEEGMIVSLGKDDGFRTWATYFGGGGRERIKALDVNDAEGKLFIAGTSFAASNYNPTASCGAAPGTAYEFPLCQGNGTRYYNSYQNGGDDCFVAEFDLASKALEWSTFFGAEEGDGPTDIISTSSGAGLSIFVAGNTSSDQTLTSLGQTPPTTPISNSPSTGTFPFVKPAGAYYDGVNPGSGTDGFIVKFNADRQISWGTFWGGSGTDISSSLVASSTGDVYMAGVTSSDPTGSNPFPLFQGTGSPYYDNVYSGGFYDAFVARFGNGGNRKWSTYFGGSASESGLTSSTGFGVTNLVKLAVDNNDNVYVTGYSEMTGASNSATGSDFPVLQAGGAYNQDKNASFSNNNQTPLHAVRFDCWLAMFNSANKDRWVTWLGGTTPPVSNINSSYFGTQAYDVSSDLTIGNGKLYITGTTTDLGLEARREDPGNGAYYDGTFSENMLKSSDVFIGRFSLLPLQTGVGDVAWPAGTSRLVVHPNPSTGFYTVGFISEHNDANARVVVTNTMGQVVLHDKVRMTKGTNTFGVNLESLPAGVYLLQVEESGKLATTTLVKH